jgi:hypothetical protein
VSNCSLITVTHCVSQEEFVANAVMSDRQFVAERAANMTLLGPDGQRHGESPYAPSVGCTICFIPSA